jgi:Protein of unknown function (DUF3570)
VTHRPSVLVALTFAGGVVGSLAAGRSWGQQNDINIQFHAFQDTRGVTVLSPTVDLSQDYTDRTSLRLNFGVDAISAASDSCARCHHEGVFSRRQAGGLSVTRRFADLKLTLGGVYSQENFYRATTGLTSVSRDLANGNTTVAGGFSFSLNQPMLHPTMARENQYATNGYGSITQTVTKTTIVQAGYELGRINGYQNSPFLRANVGGIMVLGNVPDLRLRQTVTARLRQALPADTYLEADYRHYFDDWQVTSNALMIGLSHHFSPRWLLEASYRRYDQTGAFFYQPQYGGNPTYYTGDFRLEPFTSNNYTGKIVITPSGKLLWLPDGTGLTLQYEQYQADNGFSAGIFSTGLRVPLKIK